MRSIRALKRITRDVILTDEDLIAYKIILSDLAQLRRYKKLLGSYSKNTLTHGIDDKGVYRIHDDNGNELLSIELAVDNTSELPRQIIMKTDKEVFAGPIDYLDLVDINKK